MKQRNYEFISLDDALKDPAYKLPEIQSDRGLSWLHRWMLYEGIDPPATPEVDEEIIKLFREYR